jgi:hypothetical protein
VSVPNRKPPGTSWESWTDQLIREAQENGEFDDLPGKGKPLPGLDQPHDEMWWVRKKLQSESVSYLPPTLAIRKERDDVLARLDAETSEARVRQLLEALNARIRDVNRRCITGPPSTVMPLEIDGVVQGWREKRETALASRPGDTGSDQSSTQLAPPETTRSSTRAVPPRSTRSWRQRRGRSKLDSDHE